MNIRDAWNDGVPGKIYITTTAAAAAFILYVFAQPLRTINEESGVFKIEAKDVEKYLVRSRQVRNYSVTTSTGLKIFVDPDQYKDIEQGAIYKLDIRQNGNENWHLRSATKANFQEIETFKKREQSKTLTR